MEQKHGHFPPRHLLYLETAWTGNYIFNGLGTWQIEFLVSSAASQKLEFKGTACKMEGTLAQVACLYAQQLQKVAYHLCPKV